MDFEDDCGFPSEEELESYGETPQEKVNHKLSNYFHKFCEKENKVSVTIRLDKDIVDWFKSQHGKYQTLINAALRAVMQVEKDKINELFKTYRNIGQI